MRPICRISLLALAGSLMLLHPMRTQASTWEDVSSPSSTLRPLSDDSHHPSADDSLRHLSEVTILTDMRYHETILPQQLRGEALSQLSAHSVADALRHLSGLQLKDYGGLGGIKTINIRSMGSQHVGIYYDGIELGNAQNGQIDLGQLSLDNVEEIAVYHGQRSSILQTASDFANAGSVYIRTQVPTQALTRIRLQGGSSHLGRLSLLLNRCLNDRLSLSMNAEALSSNGRYPFRYRRLNYDGSIAYDTTATRQNGDIQSLRAELNLFGHSDSSSGSHWSAKIYTYHSSRGIPGAIVNNVWRRGERQSDHNTFMQAHWQRDINDRYTARFSAKYAYYALHYQNRDTTQLMIDQHYRQQELYLTTTHVLSHTRHWISSLSYDLRWNHLRSDAPLFAYPSRLTHLTSLASAIDYTHWQAQASVVYTLVDDWVQHGEARPRSTQWTPAVFLSYTPFSDRQQLQIRAFAKKSFRMPTFNDLYYTEVGNALLRPESAIQYSIGLQGQIVHHRRLSFSYSADLYHNSVHDKIVAYPKGQQFRWTMLNLGRVHIDGIDLQTETSAHPIGQLDLGLRLQYTYQRARDVTLRTSSYYGHQIPYNPWHSGSATLWGQWRGYSLSYNFIYTGERYSQSENILYNYLQPWYTSDLVVGWKGLRGSRGLKGSKGSKGLRGLRDLRGLRSLRGSLAINNLLDQQYDVILNYPMPGRHYHLSVQYEF